MLEPHYKLVASSASSRDARVLAAPPLTSRSYSPSSACLRDSSRARGEARPIRCTHRTLRHITPHSCTRAAAGQHQKKHAPRPSPLPPPPPTRTSAALHLARGPGLRNNQRPRAGAYQQTRRRPAKPSSWRERLPLGVVRAHLEEGRDRADAVKGAFEVRGDLPDAGAPSSSSPARGWTSPRAGSRSGCGGRFEDNCTLSGEITDGEGDIMAACSRFTLQRVDADEAADASIPLAGAWEGVYVCGGTPTRLVLRLAPDHAAFAREVRGVFSFRVVARSRKMTLNLTWSRRWRRRDAAPPRRRRRGRQRI